MELARPGPDADLLDRGRVDRDHDDVAAGLTRCQPKRRSVRALRSAPCSRSSVRSPARHQDVWPVGFHRVPPSPARAAVQRAARPGYSSSATIAVPLPLPLRVAVGLPLPWHCRCRYRFHCRCRCPFPFPFAVSLRCRCRCRRRCRCRCHCRRGVSVADTRRDRSCPQRLHRRWFCLLPFRPMPSSLEPDEPQTVSLLAGASLEPVPTRRGQGRA